MLVGMCIMLWMDGWRDGCGYLVGVNLFFLCARSSPFLGIGFFLFASRCLL